MNLYQLNQLVLAGFIAVALLLSGCGSGGDAGRSVASSLPLVETPPDGLSDSDLGNAFAVGFYTSGSVETSEKFPDSGVGYNRIFLPRNRGWSTRSLINLVAKGAADVAAVVPGGGRVQVGDASNFLGAPAGGHASHQNGLDVDLRLGIAKRYKVEPMMRIERTTYALRKRCSATELHRHLNQMQEEPRV